ncbi:MAG: hypothetical protein NT075_19655 [Chloroflexi bacterium]|nr:hypothetical protein [Chloroflexota bacterium]
MLVLDEQLKDHHLIAAIALWYPGTVTHIQALRPTTVIKDDNIATLLLTVRRPTFVTINADDFWRKIQPHTGYCILAIDLNQGDVDNLPLQLRQLLKLPLFRTQTSRMGKIFRIQANRIRYYERDGQVHELE